MCGIAGSINHSLDLHQLTRDLWHRGPDEQSDFDYNNLLFHHHRLAILDIACGKQPMFYKELTLIFNGEIYNHAELRKKYNLVCKTNSDSETILHLYDRLGADFLRELDGMFALAIFDRAKNELFLARDRAGKKPLYYYLKGNSFLFSSELNALNNQLKLEINESHLHQFVRIGYFYKSSTVYKNVFALPAGHYAIVPLDKPDIQVKRWWNIHDFYLENSKDDLSLALDKTEQ